LDHWVLGVAVLGVVPDDAEGGEYVDVGVNWAKVVGITALKKGRNMLLESGEGRIQR
jgi:hypothetical protein